MAAVDEEVPGGGARAEEGAPPPVVVLGAQVEVAQQDGGLGARDHEDHEHEEQETEHVVHLEIRSQCSWANFPDPYSRRAH